MDANTPGIGWVEPGISGTIDITDASRLSMGYYQCLATNNYGIAMSNVSFVQKASLDPFTGSSSPTPYYLTEGEDHMLPCEQLKSVPSAKFSWALALNVADKNPTTLVINERVQIDSKGERL